MNDDSEKEYTGQFSQQPRPATEVKLSRLRALAPDVAAMIEQQIEHRVTLDELWAVGIIIGRLVGEKMHAAGRDGEDAQTGIRLFCDMVFAEAAHTLTEKRSPMQ
jgi:hypothetical protein